MFAARSFAADGIDSALLRLNDMAAGPTAIGRTRVVVAHRPETIASTDRVLELDAQKVMIDKTGAYRRSVHSLQNPLPVLAK